MFVSHVRKLRPSKELSQLMDVAHIQHTTSQPEVLKQILKYSNICYFGIRMYFFWYSEISLIFAHVQKLNTCNYYEN